MLLHKYFPNERASFLKEFLIRFTPPGLFNNPFDSLPAYASFDANFIREKVDKVALDLALQFALEDIPETKKKQKLALLPKANEILFELYNSYPNILREYFQKTHLKKINEDIGILCLSKNPKSLLMWSHYA
jgi:hypothetical protein